MEIINLDKYFSDNEKNYDSTYLVKILEEILGKSLNEIKKDINDKRIIVTSEQIKTYLKQKFIEEDPELKKRLERQKPLSSNASEWNEEEREAYGKYIADRYTAKRYEFEPYTLEYFKKYTDIVRYKINQLLNIVSGLENKKVLLIKKELDNLDIRISLDGKISKDDIIRIIVPIITNIKMLEEKTNEGNDLLTYLIVKKSKNDLYRAGLTESEIYPDPALQTQSYMNDWRNDNVKLSDNQKKKMKKRQDRNLKVVADILTDLD